MLKNASPNVTIIGVIITSVGNVKVNRDSPGNLADDGVSRRLQSANDIVIGFEALLPASAVASDVEVLATSTKARLATSIASEIQAATVQLALQANVSFASLVLVGLPNAVKIVTPVAEEPPYDWTGVKIGLSIGAVAWFLLMAAYFYHTHHSTAPSAQDKVNTVSSDDASAVQVKDVAMTEAPQSPDNIIKV
jgi:hypothetical protein